MDPFRNRRGRVVKYLGLNSFAELTTITASRYRARASRPSAASSVAFATFIDAAAFPSSARRGISRTQLLANSFTPSMTADSPQNWDIAGGHRPPLQY